ncbi:glycoside hydrolase family 5 protein [Oribacterium sp. P6A1]|uniref:glycoside hydrolase family 5 protein n=1 Tax=Oribacterium sp. P6A1 TaxID=1410612 RepID=UPI00055E2FFD|nr:glycoside hydrolase family 5 protein [Oribacterium sp. P6A1]
MISLRRGINLGGFLSQCTHEEEHYDSFIKEEDIGKIREMGFDHIRLPIDYEVFETEEGVRREDGYRRVHQVIEWCEAQGLPVVLDLHKAYGYDFNDAGDSGKNRLFTDEKVQGRFLGLWESLAKEYSVHKDLCFELLNEVVEDENAEAWNILIKKAVSVIRRFSKDAWIIYGGIQWNSAGTIKYLEKPADDRILFTFHFYEPLVFTHQWAHWMPVMQEIKTVHYPDDYEIYREKSRILGTQGQSVVERQYDEMNISFLRDMVRVAVESAKEKGAPLYVGEFGVIDQAPEEDTLRWFRDVMTIFSEEKIGCALWTYKNMDFGINQEHYAGIRNELLKLLTN